MSAPGTHDQEPVLREGPTASRPADDLCLQCGEPLQFPGELVCNECAEEILQAQVHEGTP